MTTLKNQETFINVFFKGALDLDTSWAICAQIEDEVKDLDLQPIGCRYIGVEVSEKLDLTDFNRVLHKVPNTFNNINFNFIGDKWEENKLFSLFVSSLFNVIKHNNVKFNIFNKNPSKPKRFIRNTLSFKFKTLTVTKEVDYLIPDDALPHFSLEVLEDFDDVFEKVTNVKCSYDEENYTFVVFSNYRILDNGKDPLYTSNITQLALEYSNVKVATQLTPGIIQLASLEPSEDLLLRNYGAAKKIDTFNLNPEDNILESLTKKGYVKFSHVNEESEIFDFTQKGIDYVNAASVRKSVRNGLAIDDIIINLQAGKLYKVMMFDTMDGNYVLMGEDKSASKINILFDVLHYHAFPQEKEQFELCLKD